MQRPQLLSEGSTFNGMEVSYGIIPILNALSQLTTNRNAPAWDLYLFNVETLIRDRKNNELDINSIARNVLIDINVITEYITSYVKFTQIEGNHEKPILCFYMNRYEDIPKEYLKEKLPKWTDVRWKVRDKIISLLNSFEAAPSSQDIHVLISSQSPKGGWPHKDLIKDLVHYYSGIQFRKTLIISHIPMDFHLYRTFNDFTLLESYTGNFKTVKQFGKKVFGNDIIPFNKYTHLIFGDKWYVKTQVDGKTKKAIMEKAEKEHWSILPDKAILKSLVDMHLPIQSLFITPEI